MFRKCVLLITSSTLFCSSESQASSTVNFYGQFDIGYTQHKEELSDYSVVSSIRQNIEAFGQAQSYIGIKGQEDLGNGLSATFQLESAFSSDTGSAIKGRKSNRESTVGLKGGFGHIRLGRSNAAINSASDSFQMGGQLVNLPAYYSAEKYSNGIFYTYNHANLEFGANISTRGGFDGNTYEGSTKKKAAYGAYGIYTNDKFKLAAAFQKDNTKLMKSAWFIGSSYTFNPVTVSASYSKYESKTSTTYGYVFDETCFNDEIWDYNTCEKWSKISNNSQSKVWQLAAKLEITPSDELYARYIHIHDKYTEKKSAINAVFTDEFKYHLVSMGYMHSISKRSKVYAEMTQTGFNGYSQNAWSVGLRHQF